MGAEPAFAIQPRRSRWKRWTFVILAIALVVVSVRLLLPEPPEVQRARNIRLGQTIDEVLDVMGRDNYTRFNGNPTSLAFGILQDKRLVYSSRFKEQTGMSVLSPERDDWPVHIRFDANGRVDRIKRGNEIIER